MNFFDTLNSISTRVLNHVDPEIAHAIAISTFRTGLYAPSVEFESRLHQHFYGRLVCSPIGLAAGFDKDGIAVRGIHKLGFGFMEIGGVTLNPQKGNPKPRLFRLREDGAIINRMGLNSVGVDKFCRNLSKSLRPNKLGVKRITPEPLGINLGLNNETQTPIEDYTKLVERTKHYADYVTINLSCPNTHGLLDQQDPAFVKELLTNIKKTIPDAPSISLKLSPDMADKAYEPLVDVALQHGARSLILTNTTKSRPASLKSKHKDEVGGLSGAPLAARAKEVLQAVADQTKGKMILSSSGGIESGYDIFERIKMGAHLVQIYTAFIFEGPSVISRMQKELLECMDRENISSLAELNPFHE